MRMSVPSETSFIEAPVDAEIDDKGLILQLGESDRSTAEEVKYTPPSPAVQITAPTELIFDLGHNIIRIPAHIPTTTRRYSCRVPRGKYVFRWRDDGQLSSFVLKLDRKGTQPGTSAIVTAAKPSTIPRTADSQQGWTWTQRMSKRSQKRAPRQVTARGQLRGRRGAARRHEALIRIVTEQLVQTALRILRNARSPPTKRQNGATGR